MPPTDGGPHSRRAVRTSVTLRTVFGKPVRVQGPWRGTAWPIGDVGTMVVSVSPHRPQVLLCSCWKKEHVLDPFAYRRCSLLCGCFSICSEGVRRAPPPIRICSVSVACLDKFGGATVLALADSAVKTRAPPLLRVLLFLFCGFCPARFWSFGPRRPWAICVLDVAEVCSPRLCLDMPKYDQGLEVRVCARSSACALRHPTRRSSGRPCGRMAWHWSSHTSSCRRARSWHTRPPPRTSQR